MKAQHLRNDPRASLVVCDDGPPFRGVELRVEARFDDGDAQALMLRIETRYLGPDAGRRYTESAAGVEILNVRLEPGEFRAWDFADEPLLS